MNAMNSTSAASFILDREWDATTSTAVAVAATVFVFVVSKSVMSKDTYKGKPLPPRIPVGTMACIKALSSPTGLIPALLRWARALDFPVAMTVPMTPDRYTIMPCDEDLTREILTDQGSTKCKMIYGRAETIRGPSIVTHMNLTKWKHIRKGMAPAFNSMHVSRMNRVCDEQIEKWMKNSFDAKVARGESFDPVREAYYITLPIIIEAAFDHIADNETIDRYVEDIALVSRETYLRFFNPMRMYFTNCWPGAKTAAEALQRIRTFAQTVLDNHRAMDNPTRGTILDLIESNPHYENDGERLNEIDLLVFAGYDTMSNTIAWTLYNLIKNPEEMKKVQDALLATPLKDRKACPEMLDAVKETQRLNPVTAFAVSRELGRDFHTKDGHILPKGSNAFLTQVLVNFNPKIYGDDVTAFRPGRWKAPTEQMKVAFAPFALGNRDCVGQRLATIQIYSVLSALLTKYRFELVEDCTPEYNIIYRPKDGKIKATLM